MLELRAHTLKVEKLENAAADEAGMRCQLLDEAALMGKGGKDYIDKFIIQLLADIAPEVVAAARLGKELKAAIDGAQKSAT